MERRAGKGGSLSPPGVRRITVLTAQKSPYSRDAVLWSGPAPDTWQELDMSQGGFLTW